MKKSHYRIIFERLDRTIHLEKLVVFLQKELGLSENKIHGLLTSPPRILWDVSGAKDAELFQTTMEDLGCRINLEPVIVDSCFPFGVPVKHYKLIKKELSKILRTRSNMVMFLINVTEDAPGEILPSMFGPFEEKLADYFRESDTVVGVDERRVIILGFSTGREGVECLQNKINRAIKELLDKNVLIELGFALFPEEGQNLEDLIRIAEWRKKDKDSFRPGDNQTVILKENSAPHAKAADRDRYDPAELCFSKACGKSFKRLLNMDPEMLWLGLNKLPQAKQIEFLSRLPFDSPVSKILEEKINNRSKTIYADSAEKHFGAIISQMELDEGLEERKKSREKIYSKLNCLEALPTLPTIAAHVFSIASNPDSSANDLINVIKNDPALTAKLLKIVNCAFYGFPQRISTVRQAVVILGTEEIINLTISLAAAKVFNHTPLDGLFNPKALWRHSICTGLIAQKLSQNITELQNHGVFTAGLLHDFGKIFLIENFPEIYEKIHLDEKEHDLPLFELEEDGFGLNHAIIGEFLASQWNLPEDLVHAIAFHHKPFAASEHSRIAAVVGLADYLYYKALGSEDTPEEINVFPARLTFGHWKILDDLFNALDVEKLEKMKEDASAVIKNRQDLFAILN